MKVLITLTLMFSMSACTVVINSEHVDISRSPKVEPIFDIMTTN